MYSLTQLSPVYLKILDLVASPNAAVQHSLLFLGPLLGLLLTCARIRNQLTEIECVLVCPIQLMEYVQHREEPKPSQTKPSQPTSLS